MRTRRSTSSDPVSGETTHRTVLLHEAVAALDVHEGKTIVDATLGGAGHAREILQRLGPTGTFIGFDADGAAIERARIALESFPCTKMLVHANFRSLGSELAKRDIHAVDGVLFDLGWSAYQLEAGRGFSFQSDEPLHMGYDASQALTARTIVNDWAESSLADVIYGWGEERYARRIARAIVEARRTRPIETAQQLAEIVRSAVPAAYRFGRIHPATKTFQALRIAVNDELGALEEAMEEAWTMLAPKGKLAIITFHSIEDRIVKRRFQAWEQEGTGVRTPKSALKPSAEEVSENRRARSAKLRVIEKI